MPRLITVISFIVFLHSSALTGYCQQGQDIGIAYFGEDKGLYVTGINDIFQDREGFLWLATNEGLGRFDGHSFKFFRHVPGDSTSIGYNVVFCISEDAEGNIWVGLARRGISRYDRKTGRFTNFNFTDKLKVKTTAVVKIFFDRAGEVCLGLFREGLGRLNVTTGAFRVYNPLSAELAPHLTEEERPYYNLVEDIWQDENGLLWCATPDDLYVLDPQTGKLVSHRFEKTDANGNLRNAAHVLYPEGDWLWVGGWESGLRRYNRKTGEWKQFLWDEHPLVYLPSNILAEIYPKGADELWVTTDEGLAVFNKKTERFFLYGRHPEQFPEFSKITFETSFLDNQGNLWVGSSGQLLRINFRKKQFEYHHVIDLDPAAKDDVQLQNLFEDREGRFLFQGFSAGDGLRVLDKKTGKTTVPSFKTVPNVEESSRQVRDVMQTRDGTIWVLGRHILYRFNPQTKRLEVPAQPPVFSRKTGTNYFVTMAEDGQGNIWIGTALYGLFRYDPRTGMSTHFMPDDHKSGDVPTNIIGLVHADGNGRIWYAGRDRTAYGFFHPGENRFVYLDAFGNVTSELASLRINSYYTDSKGDMWAFSEQGMMHFDCSGEYPRLLKKYTMLDGLPSDYVVWGDADDRGNLWVTAGRNLCRFDMKTKKITVFGKEEGFPRTEAGIGKFANGNLFILAPKGYYTFNPESLLPYTSKGALVLTSFKVNDREMYLGSEAVRSDPLVAPTDGRYFTLEFAALDLTHPELIRYEYRLEGLEREWVKAGNRHIVNYTNVPAGRYTFKVKLEGRPDSEALTVPLVVRVAFYKTGWFWALISAALLAAAFVYLLNRQRQKQQMAELLGRAQLLEKEKALVQYESLKQQLNPHFLFNSLTSLGSLITIDPKGANTFLDSLSKTYRYILKSSERSVVSLSEELRFGESFVQLQKTRFGEGLQVHFRVDEENFHRKIVPVTLQNLIENAIKHNIIDEDEPLVIDITVADGYLVVRNNLQKKKFVETSNKRGLASLQSFYRYLSDNPVLVEEDERFFTIKIPLI
ncbi:MAG: histidine kinase [Saprospiraceae bacterium]|nr:histidine kinase [Saprospiraceae bacterium]